MASGVGHQAVRVSLARTHAFTGGALTRRGPVDILKHTVVSDDILLLLLPKLVQIVSVLTRRCDRSTILMHWGAF